MSITLSKTLQSRSYVLYIRSELKLVDRDNSINLIQDIYESKGHYDDGFLPIIRKRLQTNNINIVRIVRSLVTNDLSSAILAVETFLVQNVPYYQGGSVANGIE